MQTEFRENQRVIVERCTPTGACAPASTPDEYERWLADAACSQLLAAG